MNPTDKELKEKIKICRGCTIYHNTDKCSDCIISKARLQGRNEFREEMIKIIESLENTYPKDIFEWSNREQLDFDRGIFSKHCFEIVANTRNDIIKLLKGGKNND